MSAIALALSATAGWSAAGATLVARLAREIAPEAQCDPLAIFFLAGAAGAAALALGGDCPAAITCSGLSAAAVLDACSGFLVDELTLSTAALAAGMATTGGNGGEALGGMAALAGPAAALGLLSRGLWLGWGDVKACAALGAGLGAQHGLAALGLACAFGLAAAALSKSREVRFGPHLAAGAVAALGSGA